MLWFLYIFSACLAAALVGTIFKFLTTSRTISLGAMIMAAILAVITVQNVIIPRYVAYTFAQSIRQASPLVDLIATHSPEEFNRYIDAVRENIISDDNATNIYINTNNLISAVLVKNIPYASNESIYRYLTVCLALDKELIKIDPRYVLFVEYPNKFSSQISSADVLKQVKPETIAELLLAKQAIIISALQNPQKNLSLAQRLSANYLYTSILSNLSQQYGRRTMVDTFQTPELSMDKQKTAEVIIQYYEDILAKGPDNAGMIYKSLFSVK